MLGLCTVMTSLHIGVLFAGLWNVRGKFMYLLTLITVVIMNHISLLPAGFCGRELVDCATTFLNCKY